MCDVWYCVFKREFTIMPRQSRLRGQGDDELLCTNDRYFICIEDDFAFIESVYPSWTSYCIYGIYFKQFI
jgi:hypothetical protein